MPPRGCLAIIALNEQRCIGFALVLVPWPRQADSAENPMVKNKLRGLALLRNFRPQNTPILNGGFRADVVSTRRRMETRPPSALHPGPLGNDGNNSRGW